MAPDQRTPFNEGTRDSKISPQRDPTLLEHIKNLAERLDQLEQANGKLGAALDRNVQQLNERAVAHEKFTGFNMDEMKQGEATRLASIIGRDPGGEPG